MKCDCCGKSKKMLDSFAIVKVKNEELHLCSKCNDLCFKIRDFARLKNVDEFNKNLNKINFFSPNHSKSFQNWFQGFVKKIKEQNEI
jgi:ribosome-binding protein aMBF1 (putative translation factor)